MGGLEGQHIEIDLTPEKLSQVTIFGVGKGRSRCHGEAREMEKKPEGEEQLSGDVIRMWAVISGLMLDCTWTDGAETKMHATGISTHKPIIPTILQAEIEQELKLMTWTYDTRSMANVAADMEAKIVEIIEQQEREI
ncbi:hypothetical protein SELMODRAFT_410931 [Selaginella moellendorffii]|uniref:Uncharacterized protein n=1 Tax=Selaginella moellendorffii TaxID=88036 RepID=D8RGB7_SELML|nr:hypothetical protein SELMODRAFT_410931 [Selaginella moellendorffii]